LLQRLIEFASNHPFLVGAAALMGIVVIAYEWRARSQSSASVSPNEAVQLMNSGAILVDVRSPSDFREGHIQGARNVPGADIAAGAKTLEKFRDKPVITCCLSGATSGAAARELKRQGFTSVSNLRGGLTAWTGDNLPLVKG
jgi:rhodanese-related sulfurtransferase